MHTFSIRGWDMEDVVRTTAEKMGLLVHTDFPDIEYAGHSIKLGLCDFPSAHTHNSYPTAIINEIETAEANTTSRLASLLLFCKEDIPQEWRQYNLLVPGTTWISPDKCRGLTRMYFDTDIGEEGWNFRFQPIESFPVFKDCRFVMDCRDIVFPKRTGNFSRD